MIKKSVGIYLAGFLSGTAFCFLLIQTFPEIYLAFINSLIRKVDVQVEFGKSIHLNISAVIILNNISAAFITSYGGTLLSRVYMKLGGETMRAYRMFLYTFPIFILFLNGVVLCAFLVLYLTYYNENVSAYISAIFPHAIFEIPGIMLSGAIGLTIAGLGNLDTAAELKNRMNDVATGTIRRYIFVIALLVVGGIIEGSSI